MLTADRAGEITLPAAIVTLKQAPAGGGVPAPRGIVAPKEAPRGGALPRRLEALRGEAIHEVVAPRPHGEDDHDAPVLPIDHAVLRALHSDRPTTRESPAERLATVRI